MKMENAQSVTQGIMQAAIGTTKVSIQAMSEAAGPTNGNNALATTAGLRTRSSRPALEQLTYNWKAHDKYNELLNFESKNIFMTKRCETCNNKRVPMIRNWLGHEGLHFVQTLTNDENEISKSSPSHFSMCNMKFKPSTMKPYYHCSTANHAKMKM